MLRITPQDSPQALTLRLEGKLTGPWVGELEKCWLALDAGARPVLVDLSQVDFIDASGKDLLRRMHGAGLRLRATTPLTRCIVEQISRVLACFVLVAPGLLAQPAPALRLSLREAVVLALKQNPQVQIASLSLAQSQEERTIARSALLPQAGFQTFEREQRFNLEAFIGSRFPGAPQHAGPFETFQAGPGFSVPLLDLTLWRRWRASAEAVHATSARQEGVREQIVLLVVSQYLGVLRAGAQMDAAQSRAELAQALYDQAADLQKAGVGTGIDTLRANVQLQNERQRLIMARTQLDTTRFGLARLLSLDPSQAIEVTDQVSFFSTPAVEAGERLAAAYANRPELKALRFQAQAVSLQQQAVAATRYPSVHFDGTWGYQGLRSPTAAIPAYQYTVTLNLPLFTGGRIGAETARAQLELRKNTPAGAGRPQHRRL